MSFRAVFRGVFGAAPRSFFGRPPAAVAAAGYTPALNFGDARNSQYVPVVAF